MALNNLLKKAYTSDGDWWDAVGTQQTAGGDTQESFIYGEQYLPILQKLGLTPQEAKARGLRVVTGDTKTGNQFMTAVVDANGNVLHQELDDKANKLGMLGQFGLGTLGMVGAVGALGLPLTGAAAAAPAAASAGGNLGLGAALGGDPLLAAMTPAGWGAGAGATAAGGSALTGSALGGGMTAGGAATGVAGLSGAADVFGGQSFGLGALDPNAAASAGTSLTGGTLGGGGSSGLSSMLQAAGVPTQMADAIQGAATSGGDVLGNLKALFGGSIPDWLPALIGGGLGYLDTKDDKTQTVTRDPWAPAIPAAKGILGQVEQMVQQRGEQPFNSMQQAGYTNMGGILNTLNASVPGMFGTNAGMRQGYNRFAPMEQRSLLNAAPLPPPQFQPFAQFKPNFGG
jgi:hypothetical protein